MSVELFGVGSLSTGKLVTGRHEQLCRRIACSRVSGLEKAAGVPRANGLDQGRRSGWLCAPRAHTCPSADSFPSQNKTTVSLGITFCTPLMVRAAPTCWLSTPPPEASEVRWTCLWPRLCYSKCS